MCWATDPVVRILALSAINVFVHLSAGWKIDMAKHALLKSHAAHVTLDTTRLADLTVDRACSLAKEFVLLWHVASVAWQVLA